MTTAGLRLVVGHIVVQIQDPVVNADVTHAAGEVLVLHLEVGRQLRDPAHLEGSRQVQEARARLGGDVRAAATQAGQRVRMVQTTVTLYPTCAHKTLYECIMSQ